MIELAFDRFHLKSAITIESFEVLSDTPLRTDAL
jgi:hypothetical protein